MKDRRCPLSLRPSVDWAPASPPMTCIGTYVSSKRASSVVCVLTGKTSALRPAELQLRLVVSAPAEVFVRNREKLIVGRTITGPDLASVLQTISVDISDIAEGLQELEIEVTIRFAEGEGTAGLFEDDSLCASAVMQRFDEKRFAIGVAFFFAINLVVTSAAIGIAGLESSMSAALRSYAIIGVAAGWLYQLLGLPNISALDVRRPLRAFFASTRPYRIFVTVALLVGGIVGAEHSATVVNALRQRARYADAIIAGSGSTEEAEVQAVAALTQFPWRREAQILIEAQMYGFRDIDLKRMRAMATRFTQKPAVQRAVRTPLAAYAAYLKKESNTTNDPAIWFASLVFDSDDPRANDLGLSVLSDRRTEEASALRTLIEISVAQGAHDTKRIEQLHDALERQFANANHSQLAHTFAYQLGCDTLAAHYIERARWAADRCQPNCSASAAEIGGDLDKSLLFFRKVVSARKELLGVQPVWLRPPQKLDAFHILASAPGDQGPGPVRAKSWIANFAYCAGFVTGHEKNLKTALAAGYEDFQRPDAWLTKSPTSGDVLGAVRKQMLEDGWSY